MAKEITSAFFTYLHCTSYHHTFRTGFDRATDENVNHDAGWPCFYIKLDPKTDSYLGCGTWEKLGVGYDKLKLQCSECNVYYAIGDNIDSIRAFKQHWKKSPTCPIIIRE